MWSSSKIKDIKHSSSSGKRAVMDVDLLDCRELCFHYPTAPEKRFSFSFRMAHNEFVVLIGQSGAGKSTFFSLLSGFQRPTGGVLRMGGADVLKMPPNKRPLSLLFQSHNLFPHLTVFQNVSLGLSSKFSLSKGEKIEVERVLETMHLQSYSLKLASTLSGGETQRVAIARCLLQKRKLLLLDEPFSSLDPNARAECHRLIYDQAKAEGISLLFITHFPEELVPYADRVITINEGRIEEVS